MEQETKDETSFVVCMIVGTLLAIVLMISSGCSSTSGWRFEISTIPITHSSETIQLNQKERAKYEARKY